MSYVINKTNGSIFTTVADGTVDTTSSITVVGRNYAGYGEFLGENFVKILENSANSSAPGSPLAGQLWYDTTSTVLNVYNGSEFKPISSVKVSGAEPASSLTSGDLWFDSANNQLRIYNGSSFVLVGPPTSVGVGTSGPEVVTVTDDGAVDHVVVKFSIENLAMAFISDDAEFTPSLGITGFATIKPGFQISSTVTGAMFQGTASNSDKLDNLNSTDFLRSTANDTTSGTMGVLNDSGLSVGADSDASISVSGSDVSFKNITSDGDLELSVNDGGVQTPVITIDGATSKASVNADPSDALGIATKQYVDTAVGPISGSAVSTSNAYSDGLITTLKSGAGAGYDTFAEVETEIGNVASANISGLALKVAKAGDIMTGHLTLNANPTNAMHSATKQYVDSEVTSSGVSLKVAKAGDTMTGKLTLSADPTSALHASTKAYVDAQVSSVTSGASTNGYGTRTVSTGAPSGGSDGDIWYRY